MQPGTPVIIPKSKSSRTWTLGAPTYEAMYLGPDHRVKDAIVVYIPETHTITRRRDFRPLKHTPAAWGVGSYEYTRISQDFEVPSLDGLPADAYINPDATSTGSTVIPLRQRQEDLTIPARNTRTATKATRARQAQEIERAQLEALLTDFETGKPTRATVRRLLLQLRNIRKHANSKINRQRHPDSPSVRQALMSENKNDWLEAIRLEIESLQTMGTWELCTNIPPGTHILPCHLVLRQKRKPDGSLDKKKARLVAGGHLQTEDQYTETSSPTARSLSMKLLLQIAVTNSLHLRSFDVKSAFLQADIDRDIYVRLPDHCDKYSGRIVKLRKSLYGLKQAGRLFNEHLNTCLLQYGLTSCPGDPCFYTYTDPNTSSYLLLTVHVDDLLVASNDDKLIDSLYEHLIHTYTDVSNTDASSHLGISINRNPLDGSITLTQHGLIDSILEITGYNPTNCPHVDSPYILTTTPLPPNTPTPTPTQLKQFIGKANYLCHSKPELTFSLSHLASHAHNPTPRDWLIIRRIAAYAWTTRNLGLTFRPEGDISLFGYADASFAIHPDGKSHSGVLFCTNSSSGPIYARSRKQSITTLSSTEAEFDALTDATTVAIAIQRILDYLGYTKPSTSPSVRIYEDNLSTIALTKSDGSWNRTKHFATRYNYCRDAVRNNTLDVAHIPTEYQLADILTKPLAIGPFCFLRDILLGITPNPHFHIHTDTKLYPLYISSS
jgi:hypothetical protein